MIGFDLKANEVSTLKVYKTILDNGMTVLVRPVHRVPRVSLQIWYNVGSKDEKSGEKGIAHLIEHMIFKGTEKLSESDINTIVHLLSGSTNAFTSYDYTGYLFDLPTHNWKKILPIIADTMTGAAFKDDHLNSEMKAVIQELKLYKDNYVSTLIYDMLTAIFPDHPYHYPIIGYKQDLWSVTGEDLRRFYQKHYVPNNATLIVVGDVVPETVFDLAQEYFGDITPNFEYKKEPLYHNRDITSKGVTLYRDIKQPSIVLAFVVPGMSQGKDYVLDITERILGSGKASRLYKKIVNELKLATSLEAFAVSLFDHSVFFLFFEPKHVKDIDVIIHLIEDEIQDIVQKGVSDQEIMRAINQSKMKFFKLLESTQKQAYELGRFYLSTGDENYIYNYLQESPEKIEEQVRQLLQQNFRPSVMHIGKILPLTESEKPHAEVLQEESDAQDNAILSARVRTSPVEPAVYAQQLEQEKRKEFEFPKAKEFALENGLKVLYADSDNTPKIDLILEFKAKHYYDPKELEGIYTFLTEMMTEGTEKYSATQLAQELESRGIKLNVYPGGVSMSMPHKELKKGLELLREILQHAVFDQEQIEKVREQLFTRLKNFWDEPKTFAGLLVKEQIYKDHPYSKNSLGTNQTIARISKSDLQDYYKAFITPQGAKIALVGDLQGYDIHKVIEEGLGSWSGPKPVKIDYPTLPPTKKTELNWPINRDQVVLALARLSVDRKHPDFDKLSIFDQIFGFGSLGSMASRLFQLREQSGLFYTINGTLVKNATEQPGMVFVKTIVSKDRLEEAERVIAQMLETITDSITEKEFVQAKEAILSGLVNTFESNQNIAQAFLFLDRYGFAPDYFDVRAQELDKISLDQVKQAVHKVLQPDKLLTVRVGRVNGATNTT